MELQNRDGPGKLRAQYTAIKRKIPKKNREKVKLLSWHIVPKRIGPKQGNGKALISQIVFANRHCIINLKHMDHMLFYCN